MKSFSFLFRYNNSFPTNGSGGLFTLMAIDPDVPSRNNSIYSEFLQWLVVNIPDEDIERGQFTNHHYRYSSTARTLYL